jgi:hypothetical protein
VVKQMAVLTRVVPDAEHVGPGGDAGLEHVLFDCTLGTKGR